jgi:hypothetical protein
MIERRNFSYDQGAKLRNTKLAMVSALPSGSSMLCSSIVGREKRFSLSITAEHVSAISVFRSNAPDHRPSEMRPHDFQQRRLVILDRVPFFRTGDDR